MDDLKERIKALLYEIEYTHLKKDWVERIIAGGVDKKDAYKWIAEIGHVVDEYERNLRFLVDVLQANNASDAAQELEGWIAYTRDLTVWKLETMVNELQGGYEKYLPPEDNDESDSA